MFDGLTNDAGGMSQKSLLVGGGLVVFLALGFLGLNFIQGSIYGSGVYDITGDSCSPTGGSSFECPVDGRPGGSLDSVAGQVIGEDARLSLDENGARNLLVRENVLTQGEFEFNPSEWVGTCTITAGFEEDGQIIEVRLDGELTSDELLGCRANSVSVEEVELTKCEVQPYDGLSQEEACRDQIENDGGAYGEYLDVEYTIRDDSDGDGVFNTNDVCPQEAGQLANGCANTPPSVSLSVPESVEDEQNFTATANLADPDGQDLEITWSNGDTGTSTLYNVARSGQNYTVSAEVSDGIDTVRESVQVEVKDVEQEPTFLDSIGNLLSDIWTVLTFSG